MKQKILKKIPKIILLISFLPYAAILIFGIYYAIFGYEVRAFFTGEYIKTIYGFEAFSETAVVLALVFWYFWIIPICLAYQIGYALVKLYLWDKKKNSN